MSTFRYLEGGKPDVITLKAVGKIPSKEEAEKLTRIKYKYKFSSAEESKYFIKVFFTMLGISIGAFIVGLFVLAAFFWSISAIALVVAFCFLFKILRSARKRNPAKAMRWIWLTSIIGDYNIEKRFSKQTYAVSTLMRSLPEEIHYDKDEISAYIERTRKIISDAADITAIPLKERDKDLSDGRPTVFFDKKSENDIMPGVKSIQATIKFLDCLTKKGPKDATELYVSAELEIDVTQTFIRTGKFWYPYDVMIPLEICEIAEHPKAENAESVEE